MSEPDYTSEDLDAIRAIASEPGHALVMGRVAETLEHRRAELEHLATPELTAHLRGQIAAYRVVLRLPEILRDEIQTALKEKRRGK